VAFRMSRKTQCVSRPGPRPLRTCVTALAGALVILALSAAPSAFGWLTVSSPYGPVYEHLSYGPRYRQVLDVYEAKAADAPIVVLVHGGGWRFQDSLVMYASESEALQQQGFTVFEISYDQDSETIPAFPLENNDVALATRWAIANAASFHADASNVILLGGSAGGHLVSVAAEQLNAAKPGTVRGVVTLSAPTNFKTLLTMIENRTITNESFITSVKQALGRDPGENAFASLSEWEAYPGIWSPALHAPTQSCPNWLLFNSETELIPLSQAVELNQALLGAKCSSTLHVVPGSKHAFAYFSTVAPAIFSFIKAN
jgi:acetyl esterase/lipase